MSRSILQRMKTACQPAGLDLLQPFRVSWYNDSVGGDHRLPTLGRDDALGVLVGNTRALWAPFLRWLGSDAARLALHDPLDTYVMEVLDRTLADIPVRHAVRWAHRAEPHHVAFQSLADVAGLAMRSPANLSVHPVYGPWIALRAAAVLDLPGPAGSPPTDPPACRDCDDACLRALDDAMKETGQWRLWLAVRDACPVGRQHRYPQAQILYHYTKDPKVLREALANDRVSGT